MNKYLFTLIIAAGSLLSGTDAFAQKTKAEIYGLGRAVVEVDGMSDEQSSNESKGTGGYTLLDMGFKVQRDEILQADMILRVRNEYGGFYLNGQSFDFRQLRLKGVIGGAVQYAIGDLDMVLTPYTLYNSDLEFHRYESDIFALRRDVINYEQFYTKNNTWRTQGVDASFALKFAKVVEKIGFRAFGSRIGASDNVSTPDRWIFGGKMDVKQSKFFRIGFNAISLRDMVSTIAATPAFEYKNDAYTTDFLFDYNESKNFRFNVGGEVGFSKYHSRRNSDDSTVTYEDGFYDVHAKVVYKPLNIYLKAGYKSVGAEYSSPTAQTRRINDFANPFIHATYTNGAPRNIALLDRMGQEYGLYGRTFSANLMGYNPVFGNINPYGVATANRKGLDLDLGIADTNFYEFNVHVQMKQEVAVENADPVNNTTKAREFFGVEAGGKLYINRFVKFEKEISITAGARMEKTTRESQALPVDLTSTQVDLGIDIEPIRRVHLMFGVKYLEAKGNEYLRHRDEFNRLTTSDNVNFDLTNTVYAWGVSYDFNFNAQFSVHGNYQNWRNKYDYNGSDMYYGTNPFNFNMNQIYVNYTQRF